MVAALQAWMAPPGPCARDDLHSLSRISNGQVSWGHLESSLFSLWNPATRAASSRVSALAELLCAMVCSRHKMAHRASSTRESALPRACPELALNQQLLKCDGD